MSDGTMIQWSEATWNVITGCTIVSPGCTNCYAMKLAGGRLRHHWSREGLTDDSRAGPVWNGTVRFNEPWLNLPLQWRRPRRIFVCAHADLFHDAIPTYWIDRVFGVMALAPQHTFQILTKRPLRMLAYISGRYRVLPNVWLGVSAEDQKRADERLPPLLECPAAVRWCSFEPLIGAIDARPWLLPLPGGKLGRGLDWAVLGGESGNGARECKAAWLRTLVRQFREASTPVFVKQLGVLTDLDRMNITDKKGGILGEMPPDLQVREYPAIREAKA